MMMMMMMMMVSKLVLIARKVHEVYELKVDVDARTRVAESKHVLETLLMSCSALDLAWVQDLYSLV